MKYEHEREQGGRDAQRDAMKTRYKRQHRQHPFHGAYVQARLRSFSFLFFFSYFFIAAFMCHHNTFLVYQSMRNATLERWEKVTHISIGFAWIVAALFGIAGYATFRALSQGTKECHVEGSQSDRLRFESLLNESLFYRFRRFARKLLLGRRSHEFLACIVLNIDSVNLSHRVLCFERGKSLTPDGNFKSFFIISCLTQIRLLKIKYIGIKQPDR